MTSLDGYIEGENHDLSWHHVDAEFNTFAARQLKEVDTILFGRKTYELMESFWPTKEGLEDDPVVAALMNNTQKVVVSHTLEKVVETDIWKNVTLLKEHIAAEVAKLKEQAGKSIAVLGSNNLCVTLLELGLLDELRIMINPVVIGKGTPLFANIKDKHKFELSSQRIFLNSNILLVCTPTR
jgi:dihydrofolate reductase